MAVDKLFHFYFKKLGNWNLIYSFVKGYWVTYLLICISLSGVAIFSFMYLSNSIAWSVLGAVLFLMILLFHVLVTRKARRYIKLNYQIRNFNELGKLKQYLLYAYLKRNGFITREDLDKLILFIQSETKQINTSKKWNLLGIVMSVFIAVFLAIFGGSFLFQVFDEKSRVIVALIIIILALVLYYLGKMMEQLFRHFTQKEARLRAYLVRQIIAIQTVLLTSENTEYSPFLAVERKTRENPFLQEIILSKSFL